MHNLVRVIRKTDGGGENLEEHNRAPCVRLPFYPYVQVI